MTEEITHDQVIQKLVLTLQNLERAVDAADLRVSLSAGANIGAALYESQEAQALYTNWLLSERK